METRQRRIVILLAVLVSMTLLAAPARSADWFGIQVGSSGFGISFGSSDWWAYGEAWSDPNGYGSYDSALAGYGQWLQIDGLGRCWRPYVAASWQPYTYGRWVSTPLGWTWVAYEPWGYFPHHYGSWALSTMGWVWVPGYDYYPANVLWVQGSTYVGWYPRGPRGWSHAAHAFERGYRQGYNRGYDNGYDDGWRDAQYATYVEWRHLGDADVARYAVGRGAVFSSRNPTDLRVSEQAPSRLEVRRRGSADIPQASLSRRSLRIDGRTVTAMRPDGMDATVRRYAPEAAERALAPQVRPRVTGERSMTPAVPRAGAAEQGSRRSGPATVQRVRPAAPATPAKPASRGYQSPPAPTRAPAPKAAPARRAPTVEPSPVARSHRLSSTPAERTAPTRSPVVERQAPAPPNRVSSRAPGLQRESRPASQPRTTSIRRPAPQESAPASSTRQRSTTGRSAPVRRESATAGSKPDEPDRRHATSSRSERSRQGSRRR